MNAKAEAADIVGRFREIVSDPLNLLIERVPAAGTVHDGHVVLHNGLRVPIEESVAYYGEFSSILMINRGVHEPLEEFAFQEVVRRLPPAPVMLELGAYWGHYSMWLKAARPRGSVHLVEPDPANLDVGRTNFHLNGLDGEFIEDFVATGRFGVDAFLEQREIGRLDVLHSDIQGYELEMLAGSTKALQRRQIERLFVSTHSQPLHTAVVRHLLDCGYRVEVSADFAAQTTAFDGFVLATSPEITPVFTGFEPVGRLQIVQASPVRLLEYLSATARLSGVPGA